MLLFLLGLITGLLEQRFTNVRMGLSEHLEGVLRPAKIIQDRDRSENIATQLAYIASAALHC
jgi:hypothetical protein